MDVFTVRDRLVDDYREFTGSFVTVHDPRVRDHVDQRIAGDYDAMADAARTGHPYQTILDSPPGHGPRHPSRG